MNRRQFIRFTALVPLVPLVIHKNANVQHSEHRPFVNIYRVPHRGTYAHWQRPGVPEGRLA